ncbi:hypothetical protein TNCV_3622531 [Trichonephila clavipes]|nr:hypothetical protein TNCV_3622531 [Trichonephila clavipes]
MVNLGHPSLPPTDLGRLDDEQPSPGWVEKCVPSLLGNLTLEILALDGPPDGNICSCTSETIVACVELGTVGRGHHELSCH